MEKIALYKKIARKLVLEVAAVDRQADPQSTAVVTDDEHGHYLLLKHVGGAAGGKNEGFFRQFLRF